MSHPSRWKTFLFPPASAQSLERRQAEPRLRAGTALTLLLVGLTLALALALDPAWAQQQTGGPPTMKLPSGVENNDPMGVFWAAGRFLLEVLLILGGAAFFIIAVAVTVGKFMEVSRQHGSLAEVIPVAGMALFLMLIAGLLLTIGWNMLTQTTLTY